MRDKIDPSENRKVQKMREWREQQTVSKLLLGSGFPNTGPGWSVSHSERTLRRLENDVFPWIGGRPIAEITAQEVLGVLRRIEGRGTLDTAHRAHQNCSQVFRYAVQPGGPYVIRRQTFEVLYLPQRVAISQR